MARYAVIFHPGDAVPDRLKIVDDATAAPDANDDGATLGVTVGSIYIDQSAGKVYLCRAASTGAAVWTDLTASGTPATTVESETTFGISAAVGTDTEYARQNHTHGTPANPVTASAVAAVGYWAPLVDSGSGDLIQDSSSNEVIVAFVPTP